MFGHPCPGKGTEEGENSSYLVDCCVDDLNSLGYEKIIFKTDKENSCKSLQAKVQRRRQKETLLENNPKGDSQSNGDAEKAVQDFEGAYRAQRSSLEGKIGARIRTDHPAASWMVENTIDCINRYRMRGGKSTALQRLRGIQKPRTVAEFGEVILYLPAKDDKQPMHKADPKYLEGIWLGLDSRSNEVRVAGPNGITLARTVKRKTEDEAFDHQKLLAVKAFPWDRKAREELGRTVGEDEPVQKEYADTAPGIEVRRMQIRRKDVEDAGYTEGCQGCKALL